MPDDQNAQNIASKLREWITLEEAAALHPNLTADKLVSWQRIGLIQKGGSGIRLWLPCKSIGRTRCVRAQDVADFIDATMPDAPKELVERFSQ